LDNTLLFQMRLCSCWSAPESASFFTFFENLIAPCSSDCDTLSWLPDLQCSAGMFLEHCHGPSLFFISLGSFTVEPSFLPPVGFAACNWRRGTPHFGKRFSPGPPPVLGPPPCFRTQMEVLLAVLRESRRMGRASTRRRANKPCSFQVLNLASIRFLLLLCFPKHPAVPRHHFLPAENCRLIPEAGHWLAVIVSSPLLSRPSNLSLSFFPHLGWPDLSG